MIRAIVYVSETGHTKKYAELLGGRLDFPVYDIKTAIRELPVKTEIIFLGWLMAGNIKGYRKAGKHFDIKAVCGVGMSEGESQLTDMRKSNRLPDCLPVFYLQGGFELEKLHGIYKLMMNTMKSTVGKGLSDKKNRTPEEDAMLKLLQEGGDLVSAEKLSDVLDWYSKNAPDNQ